MKKRYFSAHLHFLGEAAGENAGRVLVWKFEVRLFKRRPQEQEKNPGREKPREGEKGGRLIQGKPVLGSMGSHTVAKKGSRLSACLIDRRAGNFVKRQLVCLNHGN